MINISGCWPRSIALDTTVLNNPNVLHFETLSLAGFEELKFALTTQCREVRTAKGSLLRPGVQLDSWITQNSAPTGRVARISRYGAS